MNLTPTIGLEIHAELKTKTKMFCGCLNDANERHPNINVCPICMAHPGVLPVINEEAVKNVLKTGLALKGKISKYSQFDRKNYFYPDLPKGYQISQYKYPLIEGGGLNGIRIRRIHLEEDAGRLLHKGEDSFVDFNRAGVPLMELVTEPDIVSGKEAKSFCEELQLILRYLDVSSGDMEKGEMRCEVNISLNMGTKVEIKNLNSFKAVEKTIDYEIERQKEVLENNKKIEQETRGWDENKEKTFSQRKKEEARDYRYFPEPDLPPLDTEIWESEISLPELPKEKRERFKKEYGFKEEQIEILVRDKNLGDFFESVVSEMKSGEKISFSNETVFNYLASDLIGLINEKYLNWSDLRTTPHSFGELMTMIAKKEISSRAAKDILKEMIETGKDAGAIAEEKNLKQVSDRGFIEDIAKKIISENPKAVEDYKKGKEEVLQFIAGQIMKETKGKANPEMLKNILKEII